MLFPVLFIYGIILQNHNSIKYDEDFHYEDYVSNWNELQCCIWAFIHCYLVLVQSKSTFYRVIRQVGIGLNFSCLTSSFAIALTYWCLLPADRHEYTINALHQHGLLFFITAVDFVLSTARIRNWFWRLIPRIAPGDLITVLQNPVQMVLHCIRLVFRRILWILCLYSISGLW